MDEHLVRLFESSSRRMLEDVKLHDNIKRLLNQINVVAKGEKSPKENPEAELRMVAFHLLLQLTKVGQRDLASPYLYQLADGTPQTPGKTAKLVKELVPVVERLLGDRVQSKIPSWAPPPCS